MIVKVMDDMFGIDYGGVQLPFDFDSWSEEHFPPTSQLTCEQLNPGVTLNNGNTEQQQVLAPSQAFPYEAKQEPCQMPDFSDFDWLMAPNFNHGGTTEDHGNADDSKPSIDTPLCQFIDENIFTASADIDENDAEMGGEASGVDDELPGSEGDKAGKYIVWSKVSAPLHFSKLEYTILF